MLTESTSVMKNCSSSLWSYKLTCTDRTDASAVFVAEAVCQWLVGNGSCICRIYFCSSVLIACSAVLRKMAELSCQLAELSLRLVQLSSCSCCSSCHISSVCDINGSVNPPGPNLVADETQTERLIALIYKQSHSTVFRCTHAYSCTKNWPEAFLSPKNPSGHLMHIHKFVRI
jgi:hypothetical protein